jgi:DNA-binding NarL/FixJ family response regulator
MKDSRDGYLAGRSEMLEESMVSKVRIVLADDHREMVAIVRSTLGEDFEIVAAVEDGRRALDAVLALDPDVLITDISMPEMDGLQLAGQMKRSHCRTKIIFLTMHQDSYFVDAAMSLGASGYVTKTLMSSDLVFAIEDALRGNVFISGSVPH